jgi:hypothetical protein
MRACPGPSPSVFSSLLATVSALIVAGPARAQRFCGDGSPAVQASVDVGAAELTIGELTFTRRTLRASGHELGAARLIAGDLRARVTWLLPFHVGVGFAFGGVLGDLGRGATVGGWSASAALRGFVIGPELSTAWRRGPLVVRAGLLVGYRALDVPLLSSPSGDCAGGGPCRAALESGALFVEPRLALAFALARGVELGGYAGADVGPGGGWAAGGYLGAHTLGWNARAEVH